MKKILLFALCALCAMTASAERKTMPIMRQAQKTIVKSANLNKTMATRFEATPKQTISTELSNKLTAARALKATKRHAASLGTLTEAQFIETSLVDRSSQGIDPYTFCTIVTLSEINEEVEYTDSLGNVVDTQVMNVAISGLFTGSLDEIWGVYDAEDGSITIPFQYAGSDETYGPYSFCGVNEDQYYTDEVVLQVVEHEDGSFGLEIGEGYIAICSVLTEGDYAGYTWDAGEPDTWSCNTPNAFLYFTFAQLNEEQTAWVPEERNIPVYVEDLGDVTYVHNFYDPLFVDLNYSLLIINGEESTFEVPFPQDVYYTQGKMYSMYNYRAESATESMNGYISTSGAYVFGTPSLDEETGDTNVEWGWLYPGLDGGDRWFGIAMTEMFITNEVPEGVNTVLAPSAKNNATFNLAGQRINAAQSGIVVRGGQKLLQK